MATAALIYPHQLFRDHPAIGRAELFLLVEDPLFFQQYAFHRQKLAFHRACLLEYERYLTSEGLATRYVSALDLTHSGEIFDHLKGQQEVLVADLDDDWLTQALNREAEDRKIRLVELSSPGFMSSLDEAVRELGDRSPFQMATFYRRQRLRTGLLVHRGKPLGGKWSLDAENRKSLPASVIAPPRQIPVSTEAARGAAMSVMSDFPENPGECLEVRYPVTFDQAEAALEEFLEERFDRYGVYQDAIRPAEPFLFHSVLSPCINAGLLTPLRVLNRALEFGEERQIPLNSVEGFLRQILGWREYVRATYAVAGRRMRTRNFWGHRRKLPQSFWDGTTGIVPVDDVIHKAREHAYCHHIERLMVMGNFMLLCEIDPDDVYRWFMEMFVDAYDWVMVPNVYGMSQYADGGLITTKPYISSSNYIRKMSSYRSGKWVEVWDGLFWRFIHRNRDFFSQNPRLSLMSAQLDRMDPEVLRHHLEVAGSYLDTLDRSEPAHW